MSDAANAPLKQTERDQGVNLHEGKGLHHAEIMRDSDLVGSEAQRGMVEKEGG